jgi:beta-N-acetylhexosaminidase
MMICHGWYPCFNEEKLPASLSRRVVTDLLRGELGFRGLVMTDDLDMGAIVNEYSIDDTVRLAIGAGNDWVMICHRIPAIAEVQTTLESLPGQQIDAALETVARFKTRLVPPDAFSDAAFRAIDDEVWQLRVDTLGVEKAKERSPEDGKRSPVELY